MYSYTRYESMNAFPIAEIVRSSLQELCLYTRSFIRKELRIADFFKRLPEPPAPIAVKKSVDALVTMGALDKNEQLTKMGLYLLDLPIEPFLGKALMYAVTLKCLDPILTIITLISHR
jgi:HrpA-like RNA helicase